MFNSAIRSVHFLVSILFQKRIEGFSLFWQQAKTHNITDHTVTDIAWYEIYFTMVETAVPAELT